MNLIDKIQKISIAPRSVALLEQLMKENPVLEQVIKGASSPEKANKAVYEWVYGWLGNGHDNAVDYFNYKARGRKAF